jgi:hypothetical protein
LATLVEHLHAAENVRKVDIARYIGVSPATLRNYTGLSRLLRRGGLGAQIVELMDVGVLPASNPFAWLRLTDDGLREVLESRFANFESTAEEWIETRIARARRGDVASYALEQVETATGSLPAKYYRESEEMRHKKRDLGLRRAAKLKQAAPDEDVRAAVRHLSEVSERSRDRVLRKAAQSLAVYLR